MTNHRSMVLALDEACNFRDLGGYLGDSGRSVKSGVLYRSGVMAYFTEADQRKIATLGINTICDLRRSDEQTKEPTLWPADTKVQFVSWEDEPDITGQGHLAWGSVQTPEYIREAMIAFYRVMPFWLGNRVRGVFEQLRQGAVPLLFHCSAGKDRTGFTAALILSCLGVEREVILADYTQTNTAVDLEAFTLAHHNAGMGLADAEHPMLKMPDNVRKTLLKADVDYMKAAFDEIEQRFGGVDHYLAEHIGVSTAEQQRLRDELLEPVN